MKGQNHLKEDQKKWTAYGVLSSSSACQVVDDKCNLRRFSGEGAGLQGEQKRAIGEEGATSLTITVVTLGVSHPGPRSISGRQEFRKGPRQGHKPPASRALREVEDCLQHADIVGSAAQGKLGLGCFTRVSWVKANPKERHGMLQREVRKAEEERQHVKAVAMNKQGSWTRWTLGQRARKGTDLAEHLEHGRTPNYVSATYDVLPTPSNLHTWGLTGIPSSTLCGRPANLEHVLSSCRSSLADWQFHGRHDQILTQLAADVEQARKKPKQLSKGPCFIYFLRAGESAAAETKSKGVLATASDWGCGPTLGSAQIPRGDNLH
ncbi:hypothetical protein N1851_019482 [Merluccius polli]|uniref:Uncharacterized protein n=1 Tax=Merluccius polli TaxID=89951 RepID=A0AA47MLJ8_MERPO|nr:hypothetical protein N1851_019482 [Merluccius polli]